MKLRNPHLTFFLTVILALAAQMVAVPQQFAAFKPLIVPMVIGYWSLFGPNVSVFLAALILGLASDTLYNCPLGQHVIALTCLAFVLTRLRSSIGLFPLWQQTLALVPIWSIYAAILYSMDIMARHPSDALLRFLPVLSTTLLTPVIFMVIDSLRGNDERS